MMAKMIFFMAQFSHICEVSVGVDGFLESRAGRVGYHEYNFCLLAYLGVPMPYRIRPSVIALSLVLASSPVLAAKPAAKAGREGPLPRCSRRPNRVRTGP